MSVSAYVCMRVYVCACVRVCGSFKCVDKKKTELSNDGLRNLGSRFSSVKILSRPICRATSKLFSLVENTNEVKWTVNDIMWDRCHAFIMTIKSTEEISDADTC